MPSGRKPASRPGSGPGRGQPRARTQARKTSAAKATKQAAAPKPPASEQPAAQTESAQPSEQAVDPQSAAAVRRRSSITTRAIALAVVLLILTISYASSLRIYFSQQQDIAATQQEISDRKAKIADLQREIDRWSDPAFVKSQARERLGWVVPGETGYKVVGPDGKPLAGGVEIGGDEKKPAKEENPRSWWGDLYGSAKTADDPAPKPKAKPGDKTPITVDGSKKPR